MLPPQGSCSIVLGPRWASLVPACPVSALPSIPPPDCAVQLPQSQEDTPDDPRPDQPKHHTSLVTEADSGKGTRDAEPLELISETLLFFFSTPELQAAWLICLELLAAARSPPGVCK